MIRFQRIKRKIKDCPKGLRSAILGSENLPSLGQEVPNSAREFLKRPNEPEELAECKKVLTDFLETNPRIPFSTPNCVNYLDDVVRDYLLEQGHESWLLLDEGFQVGGISELALGSFVKEGAVFKNPRGDYQVRESYTEMSVRYFRAVKVDDRV